jgi:hypothetical protein
MSSDRSTPDQPLPPEVVGAGHGWFTRYRRYPVFSAGWVRGRLRVFALMALAAGMVAILPLLDEQPGDIPWGGLLNLTAQVWLPLLLGPWLCLQIRRQQWAPAREWRALVAAVALVVVGMLVFTSGCPSPSSSSSPS